MEHSFESTPASNENSGEALENLYSFLKDLGLFDIAPTDGPISGIDVQQFMDSLTPEQKEKLEELQAAYHRTDN